MRVAARREAAARGPPRRGQTYAGTDRQVRGKLLAVLREAVGAVPQSVLDTVWDEPVQRARALDGLVSDGLVEPLDGGFYRLPQTLPQPDPHARTQPRTQTPGHPQV